MMVRTRVTRRTIRAWKPIDYPLDQARFPVVLSEERVYSGRNRGQERYLAGAWERMTQGGVQFELGVRQAGGTQWWIRIDPVTVHADYHYWNPARSVHPVQVGTLHHF